MFTCSSCLRKALREVALDPVSKSSSRSLNLLQNHVSRHRSHSTLASLKKGHHRNDAKRVMRKPELTAEDLKNKRRKAPTALTKTEIKDAKARDANRTRMQGEASRSRTKKREVKGLDTEDVMRDTSLVKPSQADEKLIMRASRTENAAAHALNKAKKDVREYYMDPLQLGTAVAQRLRVPDIEGALTLVRASETLNVANIVSWNHCMDYLMGQGEWREALKIYNEMKKRGHRPDALTYTIMLRGLSQQAHKPQAVKEAVKIYNSIFAPNSAVKPNTIHTNAVINVCARGGDMESLWAIAGKLPERGVGAPDRLTFTTVLNAIRDNTIKETAKIMDPVQYKANPEEAEKARLMLFDNAVSDGRKLWEDISRRWRKADLILDERLICAMGRLLVGCGVAKDIEQVLDLLEVTMQLRISRRSEPKPQWLLEAAAEQLEGSTRPSSDVEEKEMVSATTPVAAEKAVRGLPLQEASVYAVPGPQTLALILEACLLNKSIKHLAKSYWQILTDPQGRFKVEPDCANIVAYIRVLRQTRSSKDVLDLLSQEWPEEVARALYRRSTFILAFSTCRRDQLNPNVFQTAQKLMQIMESNMRRDEKLILEEQQQLEDMSFVDRRKNLKTQRAVFNKLKEEERKEELRKRDDQHSLTVDPRLLRSFLELALETTVGWDEGIRGKDDGQKFERDPKKNHTMVALNKITPHLSQLRSLISDKLDRVQRKRVDDKGIATDEFEDLFDLLRSTLSAIGRVTTVAERFEDRKGDRIDSQLMKDYQFQKRSLGTFMSKVQISRGGNIGDRPKEHESDAEDEAAVPKIEKDLRQTYDTVDNKIRAERGAQKADLNQRAGFKQLNRELPPLRIFSRRQKMDRQNLVKKEMQELGLNERYELLDETGTLSLEKSPASSNARTRDGRKEGEDSPQQIGTSSKSGDVEATTSDVVEQPHTGAEYIRDEILDNLATSAVKSAKASTGRIKSSTMSVPARAYRSPSRPPLIGDELGLDDRDFTEEENKPRKLVDALQPEKPHLGKPRPGNVADFYLPFEVPEVPQDMHGIASISKDGHEKVPRSILDNEQVRNIWGKDWMSPSQ